MCNTSRAQNRTELSLRLTRLLNYNMQNFKLCHFKGSTECAGLGENCVERVWENTVLREFGGTLC